MTAVNKTWGEGFVGFNGDANHNLPVVYVNKTDSPYGGTAIEAENQNLFIPPGELIAHPSDEDGLSSVVIRFQPPEAGVYRVEFLAQRLNDGGTDVTIALVTNETYCCYSNTLSRSANPPAVMHGEYLTLAADDKVDFVLSNGTDGKNNSDATRLKVVLKRIDPSSLIDTSSSAGAALIAARADNKADNPHFDGTLGTWSFGYAKKNETGALDFTRMSSTNKTWGADLIGFNATVGGGTLPCVFVNKGSEPTGGDSQTKDPDLFAAPGELYVHPAADYGAVVRFSPGIGGFYQVMASMRHIAEGGNGVIASVVKNGMHELKRAELHNTDTTKQESLIVTAYVQLNAGETIDFIVDANSSHGSDTTRLAASVTLIEEVVGNVGAGEALKAARAGETPENPVWGNSLCGAWRFLAADSTNLAYSAILLCATNKESAWWSDGTVVGFNRTDGNGNAIHPTILVNKEETMSTRGTVIGSQRSPLAPGEMIIHPYSGSNFDCPAIHFDSAVSGRYNVFCSVRTLANKTDADGVACVLRLDREDLFTAITQPRADAVHRAVYLGQGLTLNFGSELDFLAHPRASYGSDAHGVALDLYPVPEEGAARVNIRADASLAGKGVWGDAGQTWHTVAADDRGAFKASRIAFAADAQKKSAVTVAVTANESGKNFVIGGLKPGAAYSLAFYGYQGEIAYPARYELNGTVYPPNASTFGYRDTTLCEGVTADAQGCIRGTATGVGDAAGNVFVFNGLQITGEIPEAPKGVIIIIR